MSMSVSKSLFCVHFKVTTWSPRTSHRFAHTQRLPHKGTVNKGRQCSRCKGHLRNLLDSCRPSTERMRWFMRGKANKISYVAPRPIFAKVLQQPTALFPVDLHCAWDPQGEGTHGSVWIGGRLSCLRTPMAATPPPSLLFTTRCWGWDRGADWESLFGQPR